MTHRPTVYGTRHAVSAGHYLAASAGFSILEAGGNAIDAGCAAGIALGVLQPDLVNVAGVAPIMIRLANGHGREHRRPRLVAEDAARRPVHARARRQDPRRRAAHRGSRRARCLDHRAATPRHDALRRCRAPTRSASPPRASRSIRCSPTSIAAHEHEYRALAVEHRDLPAQRPRAADRARNSCSPTWRARCSTWRTRTAPPDPTATAGLQAAHDAFYRGDIAREIVRFQQQRGRLSVDGRPRRIPLAASSRWCGGTWRGHEVITCGPWCQGPALLEALALLERVGIDGPGAQLGRLPAPHRRMREPGDGGPRVPFRRSGVRRRADRPSARSGDHRPPRRRGARRPGVRRNAGAARPRQPCRTRRAQARLPKVEADTSYCCVVDRWGNAFSATPSDGSGNVPVVPGLGITPSGRGSQSRPDPRHPGRRGARQAAAADAQPGDGGDRGRRRDAVRHAGRRRADPGDAAGAAEHLPVRHGGAGRDRGAARRVSYSFPSSFAPFEYFPGRLAVEGRIDPATRDDLAARGHEVKDMAGLDVARRHRSRRC